MDKMSKSSSSFMNRALFMIIRDYSWIIALIQGAQTRPRVLYSEITFYFTWFLYWISSEVNNHRVGASYKGQVSPYFEAEWPLGLCIIKILRLARFTFDIFFMVLSHFTAKIMSCETFPISKYSVRRFKYPMKLFQKCHLLWNDQSPFSLCIKWMHLVGKGSWKERKDPNFPTSFLLISFRPFQLKTSRFFQLQKSLIKRIIFVSDFFEPLTPNFQRKIFRVKIQNQLTLILLAFILLSHSDI